ncbi:MAG: sensor histidine kinase, partial [Ktedonobacterales bacterium]
MSGTDGSADVDAVGAGAMPPPPNWEAPYAPRGWDGGEQDVSTDAALRRLARALGQREREFNILHDVLNLLVSALHRRLSYEDALALLLTRLPIQAGALLTCDGDRRHLTVRAASGCSAAAISCLGAYPPTPGLDILRDCLRERRTVVASGPLAELVCDLSAWRVASPGAIIARPLPPGAALAGVALVFLPQGRSDFSERERTLFDILCEALAVAISHETHRERELRDINSGVVAALSHELRTPLTAVLGYVEELIEGDAGNLTEEQHSYLNVISLSARRLAHQIEDLLTVRRMAQGTLRLHSGELVLAETLDDLIAEARARASAREVLLDAYIAPGLPVIVADRVALRTVLAHLLDNAVKFTEIGGSIYLQARPDPGGVLFC